MEKALVTGCNGFVGRALVHRLAAAGFAVSGTDRVALAGAFEGESCTVGELADPAFVARVIDAVAPDLVIHLAAQSSVRQSFDEPVATLRDNTLPALNILEHLRATGSRARVLLVGSAEEYGTVSPEELPLPETAPTKPESPYALAKLIQNQYGRMYATLYGVDTVMTRSFNHTGPGQRDVFVLPSFARQVAEIRRGQRRPSIDVGNLEVRRDFLDVRDVCDAYVVLLKKGRTGETYNVCSGQSYRVRDLLDRLCSLAGVEVNIHVDPSRLRPVDMPELRGDPGKMREHTGWSAKIPIEETLHALVEYWDGAAGRE